MNAPESGTAAPAAAVPAAADAATRPLVQETRPKHVYSFGNGVAEGNARMRDLLGGKGAGLAEMTSAGIPVPPGYTITTAACRQFFEAGGTLLGSIVQEERRALQELERFLGRRLGDPENPLLVSVRSGAPLSMPGMMDTVLNLGLNDRTVEGLERKTASRAPASCARASCGKSLPVSRRTTVLKRSTSCRRCAAVRSTSISTPTRLFMRRSSPSRSARGTPSTTSAYIWMNRR